MFKLSGAPQGAPFKIQDSTNAKALQHLFIFYLFSVQKICIRIRIWMAVFQFRLKSNKLIINFVCRFLECDCLCLFFTRTHSYIKRENMPTGFGTALQTHCHHKRLCCRWHCIRLRLWCENRFVWCQFRSNKWNVDLIFILFRFLFLYWLSPATHHPIRRYLLSVIL